MSPLAVSLIDLLKASPSPSPASKQSGIDLGAIIGTVASLVTIGTAFIGLAHYRENRKGRRVSRRVNEWAEKDLDTEEIERKIKAAKEEAEGVKSELESLRKAQEDLSHEISLVPEEVDRLVKERQLVQLAARLSKDYKEYTKIKGELQESGAGALDARIHEVIEHEMLPTQNRLERRNAYILALVALSLALSLVPIRISYLVYNYFDILGGSLNWTSDAPAWMIVIGSTIIALLIFAASSLSSMIEKYLVALGKYRFVIGLGLTLVISIALGYYWRDYSAAAACNPISCGYPTLPYIASGIAFNISPVLGGMLLVSTVSLYRNRSVKRKLRAR